MNENLKTALERDKWATELERKLLLGGASFSEWATLISHEAHLCFVAGANVSTIILFTSCVEAYLRTELDDNKSALQQLIDVYGFEETLREDVHRLRKARNDWVHSSQTIFGKELLSFDLAYTTELQASAMHSYQTMLRVLSQTLGSEGRLDFAPLARSQGALAPPGRALPPPSVLFRAIG